jgi:hypothetical protein
LVKAIPGKKLTSLPESPDSLPGCIGNFESPFEPNGPCLICPFTNFCNYISNNFVPKKIVFETLAQAITIIKE